MPTTDRLKNTTVLPTESNQNLPHPGIEVLPTEFRERLCALYPDRCDTLLETLTHPRPTTFRINTLKATPEAVTKQLESDGFTVTPINWLPGAFMLNSPGIRELEQHPVYLEGKIYVQGISSMLPALILDPQPGDAILDIAAAPGSKTTQIAALMQNKGSILANDLSTTRLYKLKANLDRLGVQNVHTQRGEGQAIWRRYPNTFDRALVDVPCSMEGRMYTGKPSSYDDWSVKKVKHLAKRQEMLLWSACSAVKPGGTIVYSTCTLSPEENEGVIAWLIKKTRGNVMPVAIDLPGAPLESTLTQLNEKSLDESVQHCARILPSALMEGFFVAKLQKKE